MIFAVANGFDIDGVFINSDTLYQPSLYWDLIENQNSISDWSLNASPNFFPDMFFYFIFMKISGGSILVSSFIFALAQILTINLLITLVLKHITKDYLKLMLIVNVIFALFACTRLVTNNFDFLFNFISNSYHLGSFVMMLIGFNFLVSYLTKRKKITLIYLFLTCMLGIMSDRLFLVNFSVPAVLTYLFFMRVSFTKKTIPLLTVLILSPLFGHILLHQLAATFHFIYIEKPNSFLNWDNIYPSLELFLTQMAAYMIDMSAVTIIIVISCISLILYSIRSLMILFKNRNDKTIKDFAVFFVCTSSFAILLSPILAGNYTGSDTIRYNYHAFILLSASFPLIILEFVPAIKKYLSQISYAFFAIVVGLTLVLSFANPLPFGNYFNFYPKEAQNADLLYEKTGLTVGTSEYWDAKLITMFSKHDLLVLPTFDNLVPYDHVTNKTWFHVHSKEDKGLPVEFQFTILDTDLRKESIHSKFPNYKDSIISINGQHFLIHPKYTYSKFLEIIPSK